MPIGPSAIARNIAKYHLVSKVMSKKPGLVCCISGTRSPYPSGGKNQPEEPSWFRTNIIGIKAAVSMIQNCRAELYETPHMPAMTTYPVTNTAMTNSESV